MITVIISDPSFHLNTVRWKANIQSTSVRWEETVRRREKNGETDREELLIKTEEEGSRLCFFCSVLARNYKQ